MNGPPLFSTLTLVTELFVTAGIFFVFAKAYRTAMFAGGVALAALTYEVLVNVSYMVYRTVTHGAGEIAHEHAPIHIVIGATHGILSLVMLIALIVFLLVAWRHYRRGQNYFRQHRILTWMFLVLWTISIVSGIALYVYSNGLLHSFYVVLGFFILTFHGLF